MREVISLMMRKNIRITRTRRARNTTRKTDCQCILYCTYNAAAPKLDVVPTASHHLAPAAKLNTAAAKISEVG